MEDHGDLMDSAQVVSRSNSDLLAITMIADNVNLSTSARMEAIAVYADKWYKDTRLHPSQRSLATEEYERAVTSRRLFQ